MAAGKAGGQGARGPAHVDPVTRPCLHGLPTLVPPSVWLSSPRTVNRAGHEVNRAPPATSTLQGTCPGQAQWSGSLVVPVCGFASRELTVASPAQPLHGPQHPQPPPALGSMGCWISPKESVVSRAAARTASTSDQHRLAI